VAGYRFRPRQPPPPWVSLAPAELARWLPRLTEAHPAWAAIPLDNIVEEIWLEISRPTPRRHRIRHRVLGMEHRAPLTTPRERMPPGFDIHRQIGFGTFIIVTDFALVDWHESNAVLPSGESYSIEIWWEDLEAWFRSWAAKALGGAATALIKQEFPAIGEIPQAPYLTACETLCLFGYNRAIPGDLYFA
jgi:hypothetical protein